MASLSSWITKCFDQINMLNSQKLRNQFSDDLLQYMMTLSLMSKQISQ